MGRGGMLRPASGGELGRQVLGTDRAIAGENRRPFDRVGQLADVPRPVVSREHRRATSGVNADSVIPRRACVAGEQVVRQLGDIGLALRKAGRKISKVLRRKNRSSERARSSPCREDRGWCAEHSDIHAEGLGVADAADLADSRNSGA